MLSAQVGWTEGESPNGTFFTAHTRNGGVSWSLSPHGTAFALMDFLTPTLGWMSATVPQKGATLWTVSRSADGGQQWIPLFRRKWPGGSITSAPNFVNARDGFILNIDGASWTVWTTENGGRTFHPAAPHPVDLPGFSPVGVTFNTPLRGWVLESSTTASEPGISVLWTSANGGRTWSERTGLPPLPSVTALDFLSARDGWVLAPMTGPHGLPASRGFQLFRTTNGGARWSAVAKSSALTLSAFIMVTPKLGWAAGGSTIYETTDGGQSWLRVGTEPGIQWASLVSLNSVSRDIQ